MIGCDIPSKNSADKSGADFRDLTQAGKSELTEFYDNLPDNEVVDIFVQQNMSKCVNEFQQNQVGGDLNQICQCFVRSIANHSEIVDIRKALLPAHMVEQSEQDRMNAKMMTLLPIAIQSCS